MRRPMYPGLQTAEKVAGQVKHAPAKLRAAYGESFHADVRLSDGSATVIRSEGSVSITVSTDFGRHATIVLDDADMLDVVRLVVEALELAAGVAS